MHILQLLPGLHVGGVERGVLDLTAGLIRRGHRVTVVSSGGPLVEPLCRLGAMHVTLPVHEKSVWSMWRCVPALAKLIRETKIDVVHARSRVPAWSGYRAARATQRPFVTTCHGFYAPHPASRVMTWGRVVIVPSEALGRYLIDQFGVPPERLRLIPRGVDLDRFQWREPAPRTPESGPWRIGLVGRMTALKGHEIAIRAVHQLRLQGLRATLCLLGDPPADKPHLRHRLEQLARSLGVGELIEWSGTRHDVPEWLGSLDLLVAPSTYPESFGRSIVEAQAVGVPVVASRLGAFVEVVREGETGLLAAPGEAGEFALALRRLIDDGLLRARITRQARERVERDFPLDRMVERTLEVYTESLAKPRIAIFKLSALGDVVLATPSLRAIRQRFPQSPISLIVGASLYEAVARCPYVDEVIVYNPARKDRTLAGKLRFLRRLRRASFDIAIDLQNSRLTHLMAWWADIPMRIGYRRRFGWLLNHAVPLPEKRMHPVAHQYYLLETCGIPPAGNALELWPTSDDEQAVDALFARAGIEAGKPIIGVHPGGSPRWKTKRWDLERWAALCDRLAARGAQIVVTGSADERPLGEQLASLMQFTPFVLIGQTRFSELACVIRRCRAFLTHDTSPLHIATAMRTPVVALFGPTDPARHVVPSEGVVAINKPVFCSPCYSPTCRTVTHACMKQITVDEVAQALERMMGPPSP